MIDLSENENEINTDAIIFKIKSNRKLHEAYYPR